MISKEPTIELHIRVPIQTRNQLMEEALEEQKSLAQLVRDILRKHLRDRETLMIYCIAILFLID